MAGRELEIAPIGLSLHPPAQRFVRPIVRVRAGDIGLRVAGAERALKLKRIFISFDRMEAMG